MTEAIKLLIKKEQLEQLQKKHNHNELRFAEIERAKEKIDSMIYYIKNGCSELAKEMANTGINIDALLK